MVSQAWFNGQPAAEGLAWSRGLHYGDGVFRTLLKYDGHLIDIASHIITISADATRLGLMPPLPASLVQDLEAASANQSRAVVKLILMRRAGERGYRSDEQDCDRVITVSPLPHYPARCWSTGVRVFRVPLQLGWQPALAGIKHLNRLEQVLASRHWEPGMDEGILGDVEDHPISGTRSNLFWVRGAKLFTPALDRCGVAGVMRARVMAAARQLAIELAEVRGSWTELAAADEVFLTNSLIGLWPVRECVGRSLDAPGPVTARLRAALAHPELH